MKLVKVVLFGLIFISQVIAQNGAWYQLSDAPGTLKRGCAITWGGYDTLFALRGFYTSSNQTTFYAYIISQNSWITRADVPANVDTGGAITRVRNCSLYAFTGKTATNFYLYRTDLNQWITRANTPGSILPGATLCCAGGDTIYAFKGGQTQTFYKYIISSNSWITAANIPIIANYGAGMCWAGENAKFFAIFGGDNSSFYLYDPQYNPPWVEKASPGTNFQQGASLVWDCGTTIYAVVGGGSTSVFKYDIPSNTWSSIPSTPAGVGGSKEGAGLLAWDNRTSQKQLYLIRGDATNDLYRYCLPLVSQPPLVMSFDQMQFPAAGWQAKLEEGTSTVVAHNWQRTTAFPPTPYSPNTAVAAHIPSGDTRRRARLITPKFYLNRPSLVKVSFYMYYDDLGNNDDTLQLEYYKAPSYNLYTMATFSRNEASGWKRREILFVEKDTIMISFHGINREGDQGLFIDSVNISIDTTKLYSNTYIATSANQVHSLARKPEHERLHMVYRNEIKNSQASAGLLYYAYSDDGTNWSLPQFIDTVQCGLGFSEASVPIATGVFDGKEPWIVYVKPLYPYPREIWAAIQRQDGSWKKFSVFSINLGSIRGVSMAMGLTQGQPGEHDLAYVVTRVAYFSDSIYFFAFDTNGNRYATQKLADLGGISFSRTGQSIAITPGDQIHIVYGSGGTGNEIVYYKTTLTATNNYQTRTSGVSNWSASYRVSQCQGYPYTEPATYSSVEAYGNSVFVAWRGKNENSQDIGEIWRRERILSNPYNQWETPENKSQSPSNESHYPVMGTSMVTAYQESTAARNKEVYANILNNIVNISQTDSNSFFPHINVEGPFDPFQIKVNTIWTEQLSNYAYQIMSRKYSFIPLEGLSYYSVETGDSIQSPYCLQRDGFIQYPQLAIDYGNQTTTYELPYLNPLYHHKIKAVAFHRTQGRFRQNFNIDSISLGSIEYNPDIAETIEIEIPRETYNVDSKAILEISKEQGRFVTLAKPLIIYQYEVPETTSTNGGSQSSGRVTVLTKPRLYQNYPNPFRAHTNIKYSLPTESKVSLSIFDISGRLIRTLVNQKQSAGIYSIFWDGKDKQRKSVSSGVYFYHLKTDNHQTTNRAIMIR